MISHSLGNSEINSKPEWRVLLLNKRKSLRLQQLARADIIHSNREIKEIFDPEKLTLTINSEHKSVEKSHSSSSLPYSLPSLWKVATLTIFDHATRQYPLENPRQVRGAARIYDVRMAQLVLKKEKLSISSDGSARIPRLTVSVPDYGSYRDLTHHLPTGFSE